MKETCLEAAVFYDIHIQQLSCRVITAQYIYHDQSTTTMEAAIRSDH